MASDKSFIVKIFDSDGVTFRKSVPQGAGGLKNAPTFASKINGGLGELVLDLEFPFDDFDEGTTVAFMNVVDVYAIDRDNPRGRRIYRGFMSKYEPYIDGSGEGVRVTCLGLVSLLTLSHYKNGSAFEVTHTSEDPEDIFKAIIDHRNSVYPDSLLSHSGVTSAVGTAVSITFTDQRWSDAVVKTNKLAGTDWWWKVDADGLCHFKPKPVTATHKFTIAKDIARLSTPKTSEKIVNDVQVRGASGATTDDADAASQTAYGKRTTIVTDSSLTDANARTQRASKAIADSKDPKLTSPFVVNSNYDLESIKVGDTCLIQNYDKSSGFFSDNMLIVGLTYEGGDTVRIEVEQEGSNFGSELTGYINSVSPPSGGSGGGGGGGSTGFVDKETPSGSVDGSNTSFAFADTPTAGSEHLFKNGQLLTVTVDYTISGANITMNSAPLPGEFLRGSYRTVAGGNFSDKEVPTGAIDGVNTSFTLAQTPVTGSTHVYWQGQLLTEGVDYSVSGTTLTLSFAPASGEVIVATYRY